MGCVKSLSFMRSEVKAMAVKHVQKARNRKHVAPVGARGLVPEVSEVGYNSSGLLVPLGDSKSTALGEMRRNDG